MRTQRVAVYVVSVLSVWSLSCDCNDSSCRGTGTIAGATGFGANQSTARGGATGGSATGRAATGSSSGTTSPSTVVATTPASGGSTAIGPSLFTFGGVPGATSLGLGGAVTSPAGGSIQTLGGSSGTVAVAMGGNTKMTAGSGSSGATSTSTLSLPSAGAGSTAACILGETDLMLLAAASPSGSEIGGDFTGGDDPCGFRGAFYAYSDPGVDREPGTADDSLTLPTWFVDARDNPCANGKCCIQGVTHLFPNFSDAADDATCCWGAGLGLSLAAADRTNRERSAYVGPARGFRIVLEGELSAGQQIRILYTQSAMDQYSPFVDFTSFGTKEVLFQNVSCAPWAPDCTETGFGGAHPYHLQIQVQGGYAEGSFRVCLTSLVPIL